jgi:hypothetical protein
VNIGKGRSGWAESTPAVGRSGVRRSGGTAARAPTALSTGGRPVAHPSGARRSGTPTESDGYAAGPTAGLAFPARRAGLRTELPRDERSHAVADQEMVSGVHARLGSRHGVFDRHVRERIDSRHRAWRDEECHAGRDLAPPFLQRSRSRPRSPQASLNPKVEGSSPSRPTSTNRLQSPPSCGAFVSSQPVRMAGCQHTGQHAS